MRIYTENRVYLLEQKKGKVYVTFNGKTFPCTLIESPMKGKCLKFVFHENGELMLRTSTPIVEIES